MYTIPYQSRTKEEMATTTGKYDTGLILTKSYQQLLNTNNSPIDTISISPKRLFFGVVSSGFYYNIKLAIQNNSLTPIRVRITVHGSDGEKNSIRIVNFPDKIAPGIATPVTLELTAEFVGISMFTLQVSQSSDPRIYSRLIEAHVVSPETFKYVKKSLELQKRPIYRANVSMITSIPGIDAMSLATPATTFSEAVIMDDEDINDLLSFPMSTNVYWDPFEKCLRIDPQLGGVEIIDNGDLDDAIAKTATLRKDRMMELEEQGFLTTSSMEKIRDGHLPSMLADSESIDEKTAGEDLDGFESKELESRAGTDMLNSIQNDDTMSQSMNSSRLLSASSLLAMKRTKLEQNRRASVMAAKNFAVTSKNDSMVNSMRTLSMIQGRNKGVGEFQGEKLM